MVISLVVPAYNAGEDVVKLAQWVAEALEGVSYELIFVDAGDDDTLQRIEELMASDAHIRLLRQQEVERSVGQASSLAVAVWQASGTYIGVLPGNLSHPPDLLPKLLALIENADLVVASRYLPGGASGDGDESFKSLLAQGNRNLLRLLFRRARFCTDPLSNLFVFRRTVIEKVKLQAVSSALLLEILVRGRWSRLVEVPSHANEHQRKTGNAGAHEGRTYLRHLRTLVLQGKQEHGPVRYRAFLKPVDANDPAPLDENLPARRPLLEPRSRRLLWGFALLAVVFRLVLLPIGHAWDLTTAYNTFIDIAHGQSPYDTIRYMSHLAQSAQWGYNYEYYAYPPVPIYLYFPMAKLFAALHPQMTYFFPAAGSLSMPTLPWDFYVLYKLPMWIADFLLAALLVRMTGTIRGFRDYLLNPYVLLISGGWTFDAVMVVGLVAGVYLLQRGKFGWAGLALAFGTMVKFFPIIVVPTCVLYMIKKKRRIRELVLFLGIYGVTCLLLLGPYADGVLYVLQFQATRTGGGMNWEMVWQYPQSWTHLTFIPLTTGMTFANFGTLTLAVMLLLAYWYVFTKAMSFNRMILVTLLAFYIGSKLVNEQYALMIFPFALIESYRVGGAWRWLYRLLWMIPLAFTVMHVPIDHFLWLFYHTVLGSQTNNFIASTQLTGFESALTPWNSSKIDILSVVFLGFAFFGVCIAAILWPIRPARRKRKQLEVELANMEIEMPARLLAVVRR